MRRIGRRSEKSWRPACVTFCRWAGGRLVTCGSVRPMPRPTAHWSSAMSRRPRLRLELHPERRPERPRMSEEGVDDALGVGREILERGIEGDLLVVLVEQVLDPHLDRVALVL